MNGPKLIQTPAISDDRGMVCPVELDFAAVRFYTSRNWRVLHYRAWHGHPKEWRKIRCIAGAAKVCAMDMADNDRVREFFLTSLKSELLYIPAGWANGWQSLSLDAELLYMAPTHYADRDDVRLDSSIHAELWEIKEAR